MSSNPMFSTIQHFLESLGPNCTVKYTSSSRPVIVDCTIGSFPLTLSLYGYNCLNPPGGRPLDEYKINLNVPGQKSGVKSNFDFESGFVILFGYVEEHDVFVLWDAYKHHNFAYNANVQVKLKTILESYLKPFSVQIRETKEGYEHIICCKPSHLLDALAERYRIYRNDLCKTPIAADKRIKSRNESYAKLRYEIKCALEDNPKLSVRELSEMFEIPISAASYHVDVLRHNEDVNTILSSSDLDSLREEIYEIFVDNPRITLEELSQCTGLTIGFFTSYYVELFVNNRSVRSFIADGGFR